MTIELATDPDIANTLKNLATWFFIILTLGGVISVAGMFIQNVILSLVGIALVLGSFIPAYLGISREATLENEQNKAHVVTIGEAYGVTLEREDDSSGLISPGKKSVYIIPNEDKDLLLLGTLQIEVGKDQNPTEAKLFVEENRNLIPAEDFDFANGQNTIVP